MLCVIMSSNLTLSIAYAGASQIEAVKLYSTLLVSCQVSELFGNVPFTGCIYLNLMMIV